MTTIFCEGDITISGPIKIPEDMRIMATGKVLFRNGPFEVNGNIGCFVNDKDMFQCPACDSDIFPTIDGDTCPQCGYIY